MKEEGGRKKRIQFECDPVFHAILRSNKKSTGSGTLCGAIRMVSNIFYLLLEEIKEGWKIELVRNGERKRFTAMDLLCAQQIEEDPQSNMHTET